MIITTHTAAIFNFPNNKVMQILNSILLAKLLNNYLSMLSLNVEAGTLSNPT